MSNATLHRPTKTDPTIAYQRPETLLDRAQRVAAHLLARHSITALRISLGVVFLLFGALKFIPGASPAQDLAVRTVETLTFGLLHDGTALAVIATIECVIGVTMLTGKFLRLGLLVMAAAMVGIMSPLVLFFGDMFPGYPTLTGQYVIK
ncbi:MAG: DoxX family membrane protein, partial [Streptosporangiales bacterium]|nr:DoxX family membrane protein [Streptosporangiales bacterium]